MFDRHDGIQEDAYNGSNGESGNVDCISDVLPCSNTAHIVRSFSIGNPTHAASPNGVKSTSPMHAAITYDTVPPNSTGIILMMPLPQMDKCHSYL